jgi:transcriptional regulator GlxA family with amidase domain
MFKAEQMLKNSTMSVAEISERLGFSEQFYFSKCFKQNFGLPPREYRKTKIN